MLSGACQPCLTCCIGVGLKIPNEVSVTLDSGRVRLRDFPGCASLTRATGRGPRFIARISMQCASGNQPNLTARSDNEISRVYFAYRGHIESSRPFRVTSNLDFDIISFCCYLSRMERKTLTVRFNPALYQKLSTLSGVVHRSMNDLVTEAVSEFIVSESRQVSRDLENTLTKLRAFTEQDPDFERSIERFAEAETSHEDPVEGEAAR